MRPLNRLFALGLVGAGLGSAALPARAEVFLSFTDGSGVLTQGTATPGGTFDVTLNLTSTSEQTTGLDYFIAAASGSGLLRIADRNTAGSPYSDLSRPDSEVEAPGKSLLDPQNDENLGATLPNPNAPLGSGTHLVANYTFAVDPSAPLGATYTINTVSPDGYAGPPPTFIGGPFSQQGTYSVTIVPEPAGVAGLAVGMIALAGRRRRRRA